MKLLSSRQEFFVSPWSETNNRMFFKWIHALSIDVVLGALAMAYFAISLLDVSTPWCWWIVLATAVWSVYTADHMLDSRAQGESSLMFRHFIHFKKRKVFMVFLTLAATTALVLSLACFHWKFIAGGLGLGGVVLAYLGFVSVARYKGVYFQKELFVSIVYVSGIWFAPLLWKGECPSLLTGMILILFVLLGWVDGLMIASLDCQRDAQEHQQSFATFYGQKTTDRFALLLLITSTFIGFFVVLSYPQGGAEGVAVVLFSMLFAFYGLFFFRKVLRQKGFYRYLLELVFWLPAAIVLF
jgi:hypothetical protein